jgi:hypothetical protein
MLPAAPLPGLSVGRVSVLRVHHPLSGVTAAVTATSHSHHPYMCHTPCSTIGQENDRCCRQCHTDMAWSGTGSLHSHIGLLSSIHQTHYVGLGQSVTVSGIRSAKPIKVATRRVAKQHNVSKPGTEAPCKHQPTPHKQGFDPNHKHLALTVKAKTSGHYSSPSTKGNVLEGAIKHAVHTP